MFHFSSASADHVGGFLWISSYFQLSDHGLDADRGADFTYPCTVKSDLSEMESYRDDRKAPGCCIVRSFGLWLLYIV